MSDAFFVMFAKPFVLFALCLFVLYPARVAIIKFMPECKLKRLFLIRLSD